MKLNKQSKQLYSKAIDSMQEGLEAMIDLYNEAEEDRMLIQFDEDVEEKIVNAKELHGSDFINRKINAIIREVLTLTKNEDKT
ncbi:hypothetical protein A374_10198 [Fictibacillus macauensis ZFHKF-1]|uniref:Membrane-integrating protein MstX n=1 Tax=Fictibacillus macauensis ZFHKF-1 TaxID=1196324 RepID=I8AJB9_9BACL|nr:hypothetical protein [Fictibacillus macauensis]EIT85599.1 hypothetical protein A374_10198 [Fictibacillus macauensis ZFHKF-1]